MKCKNCCQKEAIKYSKYSNGEFCSKECSRSFSTKNNRKEINKKVSKSLTGKGNKKIKKTCLNCNKNFEIEWRRRNGGLYCSNECRLEVVSRGEHLTKEAIEKISKKRKKDCESLTERERLRDIGMKGGFGKRGYTKKGTQYSSSIEQRCFELLEENSINFTHHKHIPNSSKVSDVYLIDVDCWIEIDGMQREKRQKWIPKEYEYWLEKIEIYKREKLNLKIVHNDKQFLLFLKEIKLIK